MNNKKKLTIGLSLIILVITSCVDSGNNGNSIPANIPPSKPTPVYGVSYTCEVLRPRLRWSCDDEDNDNLIYTLKFGKSATNLNEENLSKATLYELEYTFTEELAPSTKYYWQVIVNDGQDETIGDIWDFSTIETPNASVVPSTPIIVSPKINMQGGNVMFTWSAVVDDKGMENITYILNVNGEDHEVIGSSMKELSVDVGECNWYVIAYDEDGNGSESEHIKIMLE